MLPLRPLNQYEVVVLFRNGCHPVGLLHLLHRDTESTFNEANLPIDPSINTSAQKVSLHKLRIILDACTPYGVPRTENDVLRSTHCPAENPYGVQSRTVQILYIHSGIHVGIYHRRLDQTHIQPQYSVLRTRGWFDIYTMYTQRTLNLSFGAPYGVWSTEHYFGGAVHQHPSSGLKCSASSDARGSPPPGHS